MPLQLDFFSVLFPALETAARLVRSGVSSLVQRLRDADSLAALAATLPRLAPARRHYLQDCRVGFAKLFRAFGAAPCA